MIKRVFFVITVSMLLSACASRSGGQKDSQLVSMQFIDRNGFSETISSKDRLSPYQNVNFLSAQPYKKILRVYGRDKEGKSHSKITSYHENGQIWQYLDVVDGRAHGTFKEWHPNGKLKIDTEVIEGAPDISPTAQTSWLFHGKSKVWDESGNLIAEISYSMSLLEGPSLYYHPNGTLWKYVPYTQDLIEGLAQIYNDKGEILEEIPYENGVKHGTAKGFWSKEQDLLSYKEEYSQGLLLFGIYYSNQGGIISEIKEGVGTQTAFYPEGGIQTTVAYNSGIPEGLIQIFSTQGELQNSYFIKDGKKNGEELIYYSMKRTAGKIQPQLSLHWHNDDIQGLSRTWYENGVLESEKEINQNKKQGLSFAWYLTGELMLHEEYANEKLMKGAYFQKGDKTPISTIEGGEGSATLYTPEGHFLKKIAYEKGKPVLD